MNMSRIDFKCLVLDPWSVVGSMQYKDRRVDPWTHVVTAKIGSLVCRKDHQHAGIALATTTAPASFSTAAALDLLVLLTILMVLLLAVIVWITQVSCLQ